MNHPERLLLEAVKNMLGDKAQLGLAFHKKPEERSHMAQFHIQNVEDTFKIKINDPGIRFYDSIAGAFFHTHSYKNIDDPQFDLAFRKQMSGMAVPIEEQTLAIKYLDEIREDLDMPVDGRKTVIKQFEPNTSSAERSTGIADLDGIKEVTNEA